MGVAFTAAATLLLELTLTRIFSVVFYYHFAFLVISIALFGLGAGGVFSYVIAGWRGRLFAKLGWLAAINSLLIVGALAFVLTRKGELENFTLALIYFTSALPFLVAGSILSLAIAETIERVDRVYFFDLLGAAGGCLLLVPLLDAAGGPNTVIAAAGLFAASAAIWFSLSGILLGRVFGVSLALALVGLMLTNAKEKYIDIRYAKGRHFETELFSKWNSFSRVAVIEENGSSRPYIIIDADAGTAIPSFDFSNLSEQDRRELFGLSPGLPYLLRPGATTLIIGPGGGWDVARALASGSRDVTGVEINPIIARSIMQQRFARASLGLYLRPEVRIVVEDGRTFVRRDKKRYDVLQATLVDTWASTAAGAYALTENNLYTTEAFCDYLNRLTPSGIMAFTRWGFEPPRESLRLVSLALEALGRMGVEEPRRHFIIVREDPHKAAVFGALDTVLVSRGPFNGEEIARVRGAAAGGRFVPLYLPGARNSNPFHDLLTSPNPREFQRRYRYDIAPVADDRPFFFYTVQPRDLWNFFRPGAAKSADYEVNRAVPLLFNLLWVSLLATAVILALPPVILRSRLPREPAVLPHLVYFACIGAGYILIEVALIQRFVLLLGHPTYALTVIIFSLLASSGLGSFFSRRLIGDDEPRLARAVLLVAACALVFVPLIPWLSAVGAGLPLMVKVVLTVLLIAPAGFVMGMPFPSGLRKLEARHHPSVRWAWSLNAAASVLGSVFAIFFAIYMGLGITLAIGGAFYVAALLARLLIRRQPAGQPAPAPA